MLEEILYIYSVGYIKVFLGMTCTLLGAFFYCKYEPATYFKGIAKKPLGVLLISMGYLYTIYILIYGEIIGPKLNPQFLLYLSSATIQAYAAIIFLPLTVSIIHFSRIYPQLALGNAIIKRSQDMIFIYIIILFISVYCILLNPFDNSDENDKFLFFMLVLLQTAVALFPILILRAKIVDVLLLTPPKIMEQILRSEELQSLVNHSQFGEFYDRLDQGLSLARACILDVSLRDYLSESLNLFINVIKSISYKEPPHLDLFTLSSRFRYFLVDPLIITGNLPNPNDLVDFIKKCNKYFSGTSDFEFKEYVDFIIELTKTYVNRDLPEASSIFFEPSNWCLVQTQQKEVIYIHPEIVVESVLILAESFINSTERSYSIKTIRLIRDAALNILVVLKRNPEVFFSLLPSKINTTKNLISICNNHESIDLIIILFFVHDALTNYNKDKKIYHQERLEYLIEEIIKVLEIFEIEIRIDEQNFNWRQHGESWGWRNLNSIGIGSVKLLAFTSYLDKYFNNFLIKDAG